MLPYSLRPAERFAYIFLPILANFQLVPKFSLVASVMKHHPVVFAGHNCILRVLLVVDQYDSMHVLRRFFIFILFLLKVIKIMSELLIKKWNGIK
jgi:hypothetical protein